jgi:AcrR family transcriptional regulator
LVQASYELIAKRGGENFTLAQACRLAGVTTAAPYKHFKDRDEILGLVAARGLEEMTTRFVAAVEAAGPGTPATIAAIGHAYVRFAIENQHLFRLMFGQHPILKSDERVIGASVACFSKVIDQVAIYCERNKVPGDPTGIAMRLWTFVHGAASLLIDGDYDLIDPGLSVDQLIEKAAPILLAPAAPDPGAAPLAWRRRGSRPTFPP